MGWDVEFTNQFEDWWDTLSAAEQEDINAKVILLEKLGPALGFPHSSDIKQSRHGQMRELRVQHKGRPYRILYAFDPRRAAILLIGGDKTGQKRWYEQYVPISDDLYDDHLAEIKKERKG